MKDALDIHITDNLDQVQCDSSTIKVVIGLEERSKDQLYHQLSSSVHHGTPYPTIRLK